MKFAGPALLVLSLSCDDTSMVEVRDPVDEPAADARAAFDARSPTSERMVEAGSPAPGQPEASSTAMPMGDASTGNSASYGAVVAIIERSCAYQRCHAFPIVGAGLSLARGVDYRSMLVGVTACEYERMKRVEPGHPERSWLMVKLTAKARELTDPYATYIYFDPPENWDPEQRGCRDQTDEGMPLFGQRMPATAPNMLPPEEIETIRSWIADGAPH